MYYVYVLKSKKDGKLYVGGSHDLKKRLELHNKGLVTATKFRYPLMLIYYEAHFSKQDAFAREKWLKTGWGRNYIKKTLRHSLKI